jgi:hypothetical protein
MILKLFHASLIFAKIYYRISFIYLFFIRKFFSRQIIFLLWTYKIGSKFSFIIISSRILKFGFLYYIIFRILMQISLACKPLDLINIIILN